MSKIKSLFVVHLITIIGVLLSITPAPASGCSRGGPFSFDELFVADVIVRAKAMKYVVTPNPNSMTTGEPDSTVEFKVEEVLKGKDVPNTLELKAYLNDSDDYNDVEVPYRFVRPNGRSGSCFANTYRQGAQFLLFLEKTKDGYSPNISALGPTNEQLHGIDDAWLRWVKDYLKSHKKKSAHAVMKETSPRRAGNLIRVWTVGSPFTGALPQAVVPPALLRQAQNLGYTIEVETFPAAGFAARFRQAVEQHSEPEILTFDNYGVVRGVMSPTGWIEGVVTDAQTASSLALVHEVLAPLQPNGWVMLVRSSANYEAARTLSMQPPRCEQESGPKANSGPTQPELDQAQEKARIAARAYLACDQSSLSVISDESRLGRKCFLPNGDTQVDAVKTCSVSGNRNLAFVTLAGTFSTQSRLPYNGPGSSPSMDLGQRSIFAILRRQGEEWRLLAITHDPLATVARARTLITTPRLDSLLDNGRTAGVAPDLPRMLTPDAVYPRPSKGERFGNFTWQPSPSPDVIGQVVEFLFGKDSTLEPTRLFFLSPSQGSLSSGFLLSGGTTAWRVWSITRDGRVVFSEQRSYRH